MVKTYDDCKINEIRIPGSKQIIYYPNFAPLQCKYEFLDQDFNVYKDFVIPSGDYNFWWNYFDLITAKRRMFWASSGFGIGGFFN